MNASLDWHRSGEAGIGTYHPGQRTLLAVIEQCRSFLHEHRTYFFPWGGGAIGWVTKTGRGQRTNTNGIKRVRESNQRPAERRGTKLKETLKKARESSQERAIRVCTS